jgi:hypothetical protein
VRIYPAPTTRASGKVTLRYDAGSKALTVTTKAIALAPGTYSGAIRVGSCYGQGAVKYALDPLVSTDPTSTQGTTIIHNVETAPPPSGWYVQIQNGTSQTARPLLCGGILNG